MDSGASKWWPKRGPGRGKHAYRPAQDDASNQWQDHDTQWQEREQRYGGESGEGSERWTKAWADDENYGRATYHRGSRSQGPYASSGWDWDMCSNASKKSGRSLVKASRGTRSSKGSPPEASTAGSGSGSGGYGDGSERRNGAASHAGDEPWNGPDSGGPDAGPSDAEMPQLLEPWEHSDEEGSGPPRPEESKEADGEGSGPPRSEESKRQAHENVWSVPWDRKSKYPPAYQAADETFLSHWDDQIREVTGEFNPEDPRILEFSGGAGAAGALQTCLTEAGQVPAAKLDYECACCGTRTPR